LTIRRGCDDLLADHTEALEEMRDLLLAGDPMAAKIWR
jgi:hypothetical protein